MSALTAVLQTVQSEATRKIVPGSQSWGCASAEWNGKKISAYVIEKIPAHREAFYFG